MFRDNRAFEGYEWGNVTIDTVCELLTDTRAEGAVDGLARVNDLTLMMEGERCLDHTYQAEVGHEPSRSFTVSGGGPKANAKITTG